MASNQSKFTPKEQREIEALQQAMHNPKLSKIEQQIATAKLDVLEASKAPPPHMHKHRLSAVEEEGRSNSNIFHNDEAFERLEMGGGQRPGPGSKVHNQAEGDYNSIKFNHKAKGTTKAKAADETLHEA